VGTLETLDAEKLGAGSGAERIEAVPWLHLDFITVH
jgi:hypothetical protein